VLCILCSTQASTACSDVIASTALRSIPAVCTTSRRAILDPSRRGERGTSAKTLGSLAELFHHIGQRAADPPVRQLVHPRHHFLIHRGVGPCPDRPHLGDVDGPDADRGMVAVLLGPVGPWFARHYPGADATKSY